MFSATKGGSPSGYQISRSVRLRASASAYFNRTPASTTNRRTWTWSAWVKRGSLGAARNLLTAIGSSRVTYITFTSADKLTIYSATSAGGGDGGEYSSTQVFRDPSAWYHIVVAYDSTQATSTNRIKAFINGIQITSWSTSTAPTLNHDTQFNWTGAPMQLGAYNASQFFDGYLTEVNFIDGQALDASYFGEADAVTGVWKPKKYADTYGTNGFYLNFSDNSAATAAAIGKDSSGNGNNWTPNNISVTAGVTYDSMLDVPTQWADGGNGRGNYATLNPIANPSTLLNANLTTNAGDKFSISTIGMTSGKWYCEVTVTTVGAESSVGISTQPYSGSNPYVGGTATSWGYYSNNGNKYTNASSSAYGASYTTGDVIGIAFDADNGTLEFFKNNTSQGTAYTGLTSGPYFFAVEGRTTTSANNCSINFGQRPFSYTPPTGFKALNTLNLPTPTILKGNQYFDVSLWTGTGSAQSITNSGGMQPDFVWGKIRSGADYHVLANSVVGADKFLKSNTTDAETTNAQTITSFNSNGFSVGTSTDLNRNTYTFVGWQWKEGATQGFDIVTYTGNGANRTIAHNLGVAPRMIIVKGRSLVSNWNVFHKSLFDINAAYTLQLNSTTYPSGGGSPTIFNSTAPTSSVFSIGTSSDINTNGATFVAYLFAEVAGYSKFGSYTGNGSADGTFVYLGFRPRFVMYKRSDSVADWEMYDSARNTYNLANLELNANLSGAEINTTATRPMDMLSNGFKLRGTNGGGNASGGTYIFAAFAENPFKNALAR